jgi:hypothetical protein
MPTLVPTLYVPTGPDARGAWLPEWLELHERATDEECATFLGTVANACFRTEDIAAPALRLLRADALIFPGGVGVSDIPGRPPIRPGNGCGLENWRDWVEFATGGSPPDWGYNPNPYVERVSSETVRLWSDSADQTYTPPVEPFSFEMPHGEFRELVQSLEHRLQAFLTRFDMWAERDQPDLARALTEKIRVHLQLSTHARPLVRETVWRRS